MTTCFSLSLCCCITLLNPPSTCLPLPPNKRRSPSDRWRLCLAHWLTADVATTTSPVVGYSVPRDHKSSFGKQVRSSGREPRRAPPDPRRPLAGFPHSTLGVRERANATPAVTDLSVDGWMDSLLRKAAAACGLATTGPVAQQRPSLLVVSPFSLWWSLSWVVSVRKGGHSLAMGVLSRSLVGGGVVRGSVTTPGSPLPPGKGKSPTRDAAPLLYSGRAAAGSCGGRSSLSLCVGCTVRRLLRGPGSGKGGSRRPAATGIAAKFLVA